VLIGLIAVALLFDFFNGLARRRNSIANIVSARVAMQCSGPRSSTSSPSLVFGLNVAHAIGTGTIEPCAIVGAARRACAVRWNVASGIVYAWAIAIPAAAVVALAY
jgi:PiT family inorganic phosphate transporter